MIHNLSGGANPLNFKVIGSLTEPESPAENTLWVQTDTPVTSWSFSPTEPESPSSGMVWVQTETSSGGSFNALKKNEILLCPVSCRQYVSGSWLFKSARNYIDGAWNDWRHYLYNAGKSDYEWYAIRDYYCGLTMGSKEMIVSAGDGNNNSTITVSDFDPTMLARYSTLKVEFSSLSLYSEGGNYRAKIVTVNLSGASEVAWVDVNPNASAQTLTLDISDIDFGYVHIDAYWGDASISRVWLE